MTTQLTVRGVDFLTRQALTSKAAHEGISVNALVLAIVRQSTGTDTQSGRLARLQATLRKYPMPKGEADKIDEALKIHDQLSLEKQERDRKNGVFGT